MGGEGGKLQVCWLQFGRAGLLALASLGLASCTGELEIGVSGSPAAPLLSFTTEVFWLHPNVNLLEVRSAKDEAPMWSISRDETAGMYCEHKDPIQYGKTPAGWSEATASKKLEPGAVYIVHAEGCGVAGRATFEIVGDRLMTGSDPAD